MDKTGFEEQCKEMWGQIKVWWGIYTDDDLERAGSNAEQIVAMLQQNYGYNRQRAEEEFIRQIMEIKAAVDMSEVL